MKKLYIDVMVQGGGEILLQPHLYVQSTIQDRP